jgi:uncharacterized protein (DUF983 family)
VSGWPSPKFDIQQTRAHCLGLTNQPIRPGPETKRRVLTAIARGFRGRCPQCGKGALLAGYISPIEKCANCSELLLAYQTADFAPYLVVFFVGLVFTPAAAVLSMSSYASVWLIVLLMVAALLSALLLLPRAKGAAIALLWALDIQANQ